MSNTHSIYAVHFADGRIKVGITSDVAKRMRYYEQEARRNRVEHLTWWSCAPMDKGLALMVERHFCREMRCVAMPRHREWFEGDAEAFRSVLDALQRLRIGAALPEEPVEDLSFMGRRGFVCTGAQA